MQKLLVAALSVLGLGFFTGNPDQAQAQIMIWTTFGQQSGSYVGTYSSSSTINGVVQPTVTKTVESSYTNISPATTYTQIGSNPNLQIVRSVISTPPVTHQFLNLGNFRNPVIVPQSPSISNFGGYQLNMNYLGR